MNRTSSHLCCGSYTVGIQSNAVNSTRATKRQSKTTCLDLSLYSCTNFSSMQHFTMYHVYNSLPYKNQLKHNELQAQKHLSLTDCLCYYGGNERLQKKNNQHSSSLVIKCHPHVLGIHQNSGFQFLHCLEFPLQDFTVV